MPRLFVIQGQKQELQAIAKKKDIRSVEEIITGKTLLGGKITVEESDYQKLTDLAKKQMAENFLTEHDSKDYFRKAFIHSNNQEL